MTLDISDKKTLSDVRFEKALQALQDARANFGYGRLSTAINRSYYAALNAVRSLLILEGVNPESHTGASTTFSLRFVKTGVLPAETAKNFKTLFSRRSEADYGDFEYFEVEDARDSLEKAENLLASIDKLRKRMIRDMLPPDTRT